MMKPNWFPPCRSGCSSGVSKRTGSPRRKRPWPKSEKQSYDVAVLDVKIPRISGLALKKLLEEKDPGLKFIFVTGHGSEEDFRVGSAETGEAYYLIKPVDLNRLIEKLKEITNS